MNEKYEIERLIENACVERLKEIDFIKTNSIPCRRYDDRSVDSGDISAVVRCTPVERLPVSNYYLTTLQFMSVGKTNEDLESEAGNELYAYLLGHLETMTEASLTASINNPALTIDGFVPMGGQQELDENYDGKGCQKRIALTYNP
jgi:hypothetical protein